MKTILKITSAVVLSIAIFVGIAFSINEYMLPRLPQQWQTDVTWIVGAIAVTLAFLAGLAEFTGYNLKTLFSREEITSKNATLTNDNRGAISLNASDRSKIDWNGDILQSGSTKIVVPDLDIVESQTNIEPSSSELIDDIQSKLYGDINRLPYVLTLCLDLCDRVKLDDAYEKWLKAELSGYSEDPKEYYGEFNSEEEGNAWLDDWALHRFMKTYVKLVEPGRSVVSNVPFDNVFIRYPVSEIARMIDRARASNNQEFSIPWRSVAPEHYASMMAFFSENIPKAKLAPDFSAFFSVASLEKLLDDIRARVLSLLGEARQSIRQEKVAVESELPEAEKLGQLKELAGELAERVGGYGPIENDFEELSLKSNDLRNAAGRFRHYPKLSQAIRDMHNTVAWIMHNQRRFETRQEHDNVMQELEERYWNLIQACEAPK